MYNNNNHNRYLAVVECLNSYLFLNNKRILEKKPNYNF